MTPSAAAETERLTFTVPEVAAMLGLSRSTAYRLAADGDIPTVRVRGRVLVPRAALMKMLNSEEEPVPEEIDPKVAQALDERVEWIRQAFGALREQGPTALAPLIDNIPAEHLRSMVFVLLLQRENDMNNLEELLAKLN